jgi:hypothetical protein
MTLLEMLVTQCADRALHAFVAVLIFSVGENVNNTLFVVRCCQFQEDSYLEELIKT